MGILQDQILSIRKLPSIVESVMREQVKRFDHVLIDYNVNKQLDSKGEDSQGNKLGKYSLGYARIRIKRGLQANHIDTNFTGDFHASFEVFAEDKGFKIISNVEYDKHLVKRYGEAIIGIQDKYLKEFTEIYVLPELIKRIYDELTKP